MSFKSLRIAWIACLALLIAFAGTALAQEPAKKAAKKAAPKKEMAGPTQVPFPNGKHGGVLRALLRENWPSLSPQEESTISTTWPAAPMFNNLLVYDPFRPAEDGDHLVGDLAESWAWSDGNKKLTFKLHRGVKWHDGKPFTANDVKFTFDVARGVSDKRFKLNPRKDWWANVQEIATNGDYEVSFILKAPQPSLLAYLANGYTPVYPGHLDPQQMRTQPVGTGPFKLKEAKPDEQLVLEKNPDYFVKDRPYLDGIVFTVIRERASRVAAMQANQLDIFFPGEGNLQMRDQLKTGAPQVVFHQVAQGVTDNILLNVEKPPFNNPKLRLAVNLALDRAAMIKSIHQGAALQGGANIPPPYGKWGLVEKDLVKMPGYGDPAKNKAEAKRLLAEAGYSPSNPLKVAVATRAIQVYVDTAVWVIDQLKQVGIEGTLEQFETGVWHPKMTRGEYEIAMNLTGVAVDDPDGNFFENYTCASPRTFHSYCNKDLELVMAQASAEANPAKRLRLVRDIDKRLQMEGARPILAHRQDFFSYWPYVKNLVPHHNIYNYGRMQEVWLDK
jgi:peptide/nickel transport system substrate-binding protein